MTKLDAKTLREVRKRMGFTTVSEQIVPFRPSKRAIELAIAGKLDAKMRRFVAEKLGFTTPFATRVKFTPSDWRLASRLAGNSTPGLRAPIRDTASRAKTRAKRSR